MTGRQKWTKAPVRESKPQQKLVKGNGGRKSQGWAASFPGQHQTEPWRISPARQETLKPSFCAPNTTDKISFYSRNTEAWNCPFGFSCSFLTSVQSCESKGPFFFPFIFSRNSSGSTYLVQCDTLGLSLINKAGSIATIEFVSHNVSYRQINRLPDLGCQLTDAWHLRKQAEECIRAMGKHKKYRCAKIWVSDSGSVSLSVAFKIWTSYFI